MNQKFKYIIYKTYVDNSAKKNSEALFKEPCGCLDYLEQAESFCRTGKQFTNKDCWAIGENHSIPEYTFGAVVMLEPVYDEYTEQIALIRKVVSLIQENKDLRDTLYLYRGKLSIENIADAAGNHLFDDKPFLFGISNIEGHAIREYFQVRTLEQIEADFKKYNILS